MKSITYAEMYRLIGLETVMVIFFKKDGNVRTLLGTRNPQTIGLYNDIEHIGLAGHDKRCNINNGNIAIFDLILGEARSFNMERLGYWASFGEITSKEKLDSIIDKFLEYKEKQEAALKAEYDLF